MLRINRIWITSVAGLVLTIAGSAFADIGDQLAKLLANDGAAGDNFGIAVDISGSIGIAGAYEHDDFGQNTGAAYLFDINTGQQISKLLADDGSGGDLFGRSVAISGAMAIVGASKTDDNGSSSGSVYVFDISDPANPVQTAKLLADDGDEGNFFGEEVALSGSTAVIGVNQHDHNGNHIFSGSVYVFDITTGEQLFEFLQQDDEQFDRFGASIAISGTTVIVGAPSDDDIGANSGSAYLFDTRTGEEMAKFHADDGAEFENFGESVGISGVIAIVGAEGNDDLFGSAYLFDVTNPSNPVQIAKLVADDAAELDEFGTVAIGPSFAIVGAQWDDDNGDRSGSAYLFDAMTGIQITKLLPDDGGALDRFGSSVAISGSTVIVGAYLDDDHGMNSGSAYVFDAACACDDPEVCDCNDNGVPDDCDIANGTSTDCNANGVPDECEPFEDCNDNGVLDACDIADGISIDCNANGVPDACDLADGTSADCNRNGVPDECDIDNGAEDCSGDGIPDICQPDCPWELTGDCLVGTSDLLLLLGWWGGDPGGPPDFNGDGVVNAADLIELLGNWGPCPP